MTTPAAPPPSYPAAPLPPYPGASWPSPAAAPVLPLPQRPPVPPGRDRDDDRVQSARPAAAWLAITGCSLLMVAAIVVVAGRWHAIGPLGRLGALVTAILAVFGSAEALRGRVPTTARVIAEFGAWLAAPVGVAAAAALSQPWPICLIAGGVGCTVAAAIQQLRWRAPALVLASTTAMALAIAGGAAEFHQPVGVLVGAAAVVLLIAGLERRAIMMAGLAALAPILTGLASVKVGRGTIARLGSTGHGLVWAAPVAATLAAAVFAVLATRRSSAAAALAAAASLGLGAAVGLGAAHASTVTWLCVPAVVIAVIEVLAAAGQGATGIWQAVARRASRAVSMPLSSSGGVAILVTAVARAANPQSGPLAHSLATPVAMTVGAVVAVCLRRVKVASPSFDIALAGVVSWSVALAITIGGSAVACAAIAAVGLVITVADRRRPLAITAVTAAALGFLCLEFTAYHGSSLGFSVRIFVMTLIVSSVIVNALRLDRAGSSALLTIAVCASAALAGHVIDMAHATGAVGALAVLGVAVAIIRPRFGGRAVIASGALAAMQFDALLIHWRSAVAIGIAGLVSLVIASTVMRGRRSGVAHLGIAEIVLAASVGLAAGHVHIDLIVGMLIVAAVTMSGIAFTSPRISVLDTGGVACALSAMVISFGGTRPQLVSLAFITVAAQALAYSAARQDRSAIAASAAALVASTSSLWWTTGLNEHVLRSLQRHNVSGTDLILLAVGLLLLGGGVLQRRALHASSWLAYGPGLGLLSTWLLVTAASRDTSWAIIGALTLGIAATAVGGLRRLAAPLVMGTALTAASVVISSAEQLAAMPPWVWLVVGGLGLLVLAFGTERAVNSDHTDVGSVLDAVRDRFE